MDRIRILLCGHPNPLGCPNHGDVAREIYRCEQDTFRYRTVYEFLFARRCNLPIEYELTQKARDALRSAGIKPPHQES